MIKICGICSFKKNIYWRYSPGKSEEKKPGFFSDSKRKDPRKLNERIILAFKKNKRYETSFSVDGILVIHGEKGKAYPVLCRKKLLKNFLKKHLVALL